MHLFAGIDVGQSATKVALADEEGVLLARASGPAGDELGLGAASTRLRDAVESTLAAAVKRAGLPASARFTSLVVGISGFDRELQGRRPRIHARHLRYTHDAEIALAGAHAGAPGIVAIAGTGSVVRALARGGSEVRIGGHGYLFGDEGSAFGLARDSLRAAVLARDERRASGLLAALERHFGCTAAECVRGFYSGTIARAKLAGFAPALLAEAQRGERTARAIVHAHALALAAQIRAAARLARMRSPEVALLGGLAANATFERALRSALRGALPGARYRRPIYDAALGALLLAFTQAGITLREIAER
ncbi:MAG: hypothetical protein HKL91_04205 [Candidatus Eremiobacteraeota bacterium]|uniref:Putative ATPase, BadF/BadG/BcrA/BcrD type n=1 Tax=mine drainage metagenome TaxID=410659 RepID=E6PEV9_9ZZZZ|nr:hypothetical protein [Candidatus Eremiobacteraeota bacterium]